MKLDALIYNSIFSLVDIFDSLVSEHAKSYKYTIRPMFVKCTVVQGKLIYFAQMTQHILGSSLCN